MTRSLTFMSWIFAGAGTLSLLGSVYAAAEEILFLRHAVRVEGTVIGLEDHRATEQPAYRYEYPPGTPRRGLGSVTSSSDRYLHGDPLPLYVDERDPDSSQIRRFDHQWLAALTFAIFAAGFGGFGFGILAYDRRQRALKRLLLDRGVRIRAEIVAVARAASATIDDVSPWRIEARGLVEGKVYRFMSENLLYDPSPYLDGNRVEVVYLPEDPRKHFMDLAFLPEYVR